MRIRVMNDNTNRRKIAALGVACGFLLMHKLRKWAAMVENDEPVHSMSIAEYIRW